MPSARSPTAAPAFARVLFQRQSGAAAARRSQWLSHAQHGGRRKTGRDLRIRCSWRGTGDARSTHLHAGAMRAQQLALRLDVCWAGDSNESPPEELDAALIFASAGALVPATLNTKSLWAAHTDSADDAGSGRLQAGGQQWQRRHRVGRRRGERTGANGVCLRREPVNVQVAAGATCISSDRLIRNFRR
jgi:hypothetical protein